MMKTTFDSTALPSTTEELPRVAKRCLSVALRCATMAAALAITGCGMGTVNDPGQIASTVAVEPPMSGSVYGGHAPLLGAKLYVLTPSTTANAGLATSLMKSTTTNTQYPVTLDTSGGATNGMYYVTTDQYGVFNLTGSYTCTANQPVYLAATGGAPSYSGAGPNVFTVTQMQVQTVSGVNIFTYTTSSPELFYVGETVSVTGFTGGQVGYNQTGTVQGSGLTTTSFSIAPTPIYTGGGQTATLQTAPAGVKVTGTPVQNPAVVNMTALGACPSSGNFSTVGNGAISYIYMNEISTAVMAYAMAGFGTDGFHIGANLNGPLNKTSNPGYVTGSLLQALNNASLMYDITGGNQGTAYAGEGHIARSQTPAANGIVPQTKIDTLGNILAACVDSANTLASPSTACSTLFATATADGSSTGTKPTDISGAAFNIAHYPAGTNNTNFATTLFNIPTGNVPFLPQLSAAPTDWTLVLAFVAPDTPGGGDHINNPQIISIDGSPYVGIESGTSQPANSVWIGSYGNQPVKLFTTGTPDYVAISGGLANETRVRAIAFDLNNNPWILNEATGNTQHYNNSASTLITTVAPANNIAGTYNQGTSVALDASSNVYIDNEDLIQKVSSTGTNITPGGTYWSSNNANIGGGTGSPFTNTVYLDSTGLVYTIAASGLGGAGKLCVANPATANCNQLISGFTVGTLSNALTFSSLDGNNTFWSTNYASNNLVGYNYASQPGSIKYTFTGGGMNSPSATAIDGAGNIWVANSGGILSGNTSVNSLSAFTPTGTALSPTTGFGAIGGNVSTNSSDLAIDRAGNIWVVYSGTAYVYEYIGIAAPAVTATQFATFNGFLGKRPL